MKKLIFIFFLLIIHLSVFSQHILSGKVIGITDGDTFTLLTSNKKQHKIRLAEIDSPEKAQPFGNAAKYCLSDLIFGKIVKVIKVDEDKYERIIGKVYLDGIYLSEEMISKGYAWHFKKYSNSLELSIMENVARKKKDWIVVSSWSNCSLGMEKTKIMINESYVLMTDQSLYFVEYLCNELVFSDTLSQAMIFNDLDVAGKFKDMLLEKCKVYTTINPIIN